MKKGETPKRGVNWAAHERFKNPEHHRRHAKSHRIAQAYCKSMADDAYGRGKRKWLDRADLHRKWAEKHEQRLQSLKG